MKNKLYENILLVISIITFIMLLSILGWLALNLDDGEGLPDTPLVPSSFSSNFSEIGNFTLDSGWQLVSMPDNINKTSIYINYENNTYNWNDAIDNNLIANVVMEYTNNGYVSTNYLLKTRGYWIYCYVDGIQLSDEPSIIYCSKLYTGFSNMSNITCSKVIISPELYDNEIYCNTFIATDFYEFYYLGGEVLQ